MNFHAIYRKVNEQQYFQGSNVFILVLNLSNYTNSTSPSVLYSLKCRRLAGKLVTKKVSVNQFSCPTETRMELFDNHKSIMEAVYIDLEYEDNINGVYSQWSELPSIILENIFSYLSTTQKYYASLVCTSWYRAFYLPSVWSQFVLQDSTLTRGRFNYYSGWQHVLDHLRAQTCLNQVGKYFRNLIFDPMLNFFNLYEFMNMLSWYMEQTNKDITVYSVGTNIRSLKFTFPCNMSNRNERDRTRLFGTGGKILEALKRLMGNLRKLKKLELIDLMLDPKEAQYLLDEVCQTCCLNLRTLILINTTRVHYQLLHVGVFLHLQDLTISPQNLGDDLVELIGYTKLQHLHILQNRYSASDSTIKSASGRAWKLCRASNPHLNVHLQIQSSKEKNLVWQENAPVKTILYNSPQIGLETLTTAIELYQNYLHIYGHQNVPKFYRAKSFHKRIDGALLLLCKHCPRLKVLIITERISTATVLLIAYTAKKLKYLYVRGNAVIKRCDWVQSPEWTDIFYNWLKRNSRSYTLVEKEVSHILGYKWQMQSDKQFKNLVINLHDENLL